MILFVFPKISYNFGYDFDENNVFPMWIWSLKYKLTQLLMYKSNEDITDGLRVEYKALNEPFIAEALEDMQVRYH